MVREGELIIVLQRCVSLLNSESDLSWNFLNHFLDFNHPDSDMDDVEVIDEFSVRGLDLEKEDYVDEARDHEEGDVEALVSGGAVGGDEGQLQPMEGSDDDEDQVIAEGGNYEMSSEDMQVSSKVFMLLVFLII